MMMTEIKVPDLKKVPVHERKSLLGSNIRSLIEKSSYNRLSERNAIEERLSKITSIKFVDPEMEKIESEKREEMEKARKSLLEIEKEIEEESERILSRT